MPSALWPASTTRVRRVQPESHHGQVFSRQRATSEGPRVAQALLPVRRLMHSMHSAQAGVPVPLKP